MGDRFYLLDRNGAGVAIDINGCYCTISKNDYN
jgi:hypothetical protein